MALEIVLFLVSLALLFCPLENLIPQQRGRFSKLLSSDITTTARQAIRRGIVGDIALGGLGIFVLRLAAPSLMALGASLADLGGSEPLWAFIQTPMLRNAVELASGLLVFELGGYAYHRLAHQNRFLWHMHRVHHQSTHMDWLASFRQHPLELLLMSLFQNLPLWFLGIPLGNYFAILLLMRVHTVFVHSNLRIQSGWWSEIWTMPAFHHRHHALHGAPGNFSSVFPWMDRLFGTHFNQVATQFGVMERPSQTSQMS